MSSSNVPQNPTSHNVASILPKLQDADPDIRYMTLNDLHKMLENGNPMFLLHDYTTCCKIVDGLLHTLADTHGDVQNMAIQCLGPFVQKAPENILCPTIEKVSNIKAEGGLDNSIPALGVRTIVIALPHPVGNMPRTQKIIDSYSAVSKALIPRLVGRVVVPISAKNMPAPPKGMLEEDLETGVDSNSLDLLTEVAKGFGPMLQEAEVQALEDMTIKIIESDRCGSVLKKKSVAALSALAPYLSDALLAQHVSKSIEKLRNPHLTAPQRRLYITIFGALARAIPSKFGPYLKTLAPFVLAPLSEEELEQQREAEIDADGERDLQLEDVREAALVAIESFLQACPQDMKPYAKDVIESSLRFLKYEPNVAADDEDEEMEDEDADDDFGMEDDFEPETGFEDEDDVSWKVRRCSAKALHAVIATLDANDAAIYNQIAPALIARFKEEEESVRTEVVTTLAYLVTKTGSAISKARPPEHTIQPQGKKRRRGLSDSLGVDFHAQKIIMAGYASPTTPPPVDSATQSLARLNPEIVKHSAKLLKTSTVPTKQVVLALLKDMVLAQHGGLSNTAELVISPVIETMSSSPSSVSNMAANALRVEALALLRAIAESHSSKVIAPYLGKIIPVLTAASKDRYAKVSVEACITIECYVKALTPPRSGSTAAENGKYLLQLNDAITKQISATDTDTEVRQKAVQALGLLIGRTSGAIGGRLLSQEVRFAGQQLIADRMKNELTRLSCVRAVDTIAVLAHSRQDFKPDFVSSVALELGAQLRKASRSLRGASLSALRMLAINQASRESMDDETVAQLVDMLVPLLTTQDLHMISPALFVLAAFSKDKPALIATDPVIEGICEVLCSNLSGAALDGVLACVENMGLPVVGESLMQALLNIELESDHDILGQVIGTLVVCSNGNAGLDLDSFILEMELQQGDESKKCLSLSVLGEAGLRLGTSSPLTPLTFTPHFKDESDKVKLAAAIALGRSGAGNVKAYLPEIMRALNTPAVQYLLLHSIKELLHHSTAEDEIKPFTQSLWTDIIQSGQSEDNKVVAAECLGRVAIMDPAIYLKKLHSLLQNSNSQVRGMAISALRYVFADTDSTFDHFLQGTITSMLEVMLADNDLDNQRLSLSAFNSAFHNKPALVLPHLPQLLPFAMQATVPRPELVREVTMGPFKHKVDDGLEIRKSAYETLYALLDSPASQERLDLNGIFYDRIVAGIGDEQEIKILCCLLLTKLMTLAPGETVRRLDTLAPQFRTVLAFKPKDTAVKQELEKLSEQSKAVVKVSVAINKLVGLEDNRSWKDFFDWVCRDFPHMVRQAEDEWKDGRDR